MFTPFQGLVTLLALIISTHVCVFSQSDFTVAGGDATGVSGYMSFSIGQVSHEAYQSNNGTISLGVQQSHLELLTLDSYIEETDSDISLYPNPARDYFQIKGLHDVPSNSEAKIYDVFGRQLKILKTISDDERITIGAWPPGIYFIKVFQNQTLIKSIKLIKS